MDRLRRVLCHGHQWYLGFRVLARLSKHLDVACVNNLVSLGSASLFENRDSRFHKIGRPIYAAFKMKLPEGVRRCLWSDHHVMSSFLSEYELNVFFQIYLVSMALFHKLLFKFPLILYSRTPGAL